MGIPQQFPYKVFAEGCTKVAPMKKLQSLLTATLLAFAMVPSIAMAIAIEELPPVLTGNNTTFNFSATCFDCTGERGVPGDPSQVGGTLVLQDYVFNSQITRTNFVSFSYAGPSDHIQPFTVSSTDLIYFVGGSVGATSAPTDGFNLGWETDLVSKFFWTQGTSWGINFHILGEDDDDFGNNIAFSQVSVPAPSSLALFGLGLVALAFRRKTKSKTA